MLKNRVSAIAITSLGLLLVLGAARRAVAQDPATRYPTMAPLGDYLMANQAKRGYGGDSAPHWPSHLMFFYSDVDPAIWGANLPGSPVVAVADPLEHLTQFVITTPLWSDGTKDLSAARGSHRH